jgi:hypothetical protein
MMNHKEILESAESILMDRAGLYGSEEILFERACTLYNVFTGQNLTPFEANAFMVCLKMARMRFDRKVADNYVDAINYLSFMAQFAGAEVPGSAPAAAVKPKIPDMAPLPKNVEDEIKELADKFKPVQAI